jgi:hypothetical protein
MSTQAQKANIEFRPRTEPVHRSADERIFHLLALYPNISRAEEREILTFLKNARYLDIALLKADRTVKRQLDLFIGAHTRTLSFSAAEVIAIACMVIAFLATCWLLWQATLIGGA